MNFWICGAHWHCSIPFVALGVPWSHQTISFPRYYKERRRDHSDEGRVVGIISHRGYTMNRVKAHFVHAEFNRPC